MAETTPTPAASAGRAAFVFILIMVAFDFLAFGIIAPVLPDLIRHFEGGDFARASNITGYFGFAWATMQFIFSPILGAWSDRFGRRPVILISCFGLSIDYVFMALAPSLAWLFVGRIISGITTSNVSTAFAYITDVTPPEKRAKPFGLVSAAFGLGFVIGPAVGGYLGNMNLRFPFWAAAILSLANALYGYFILPESLPPERRAKSAWHMANPLGSLNLLRSHPELAGLSVVTTLYYLAHNSLPSMWALYTEYRYTWNRRDVGLSLCQTVRRAAQRALRPVVWHSRLRGIRSRQPRLDDARRHSFDSPVGHRCSRHAIADVPARGRLVSRQTARSHQFPSRGHRHGGPGSLYPGFRRCNLTSLWPPSDGSAVLSRSTAAPLQPAAGGVRDATE